MKKKIMSVVMSIVMLLMCCGLAGCNPNEIEVGDFIYYKENAGTKNVAVEEISALGKEKEYLYIPEKIIFRRQEYFVTQVGALGWVSCRDFMVDSDNLKFLYFPWTVCPLETFVRFYSPKLEAVFITCTTCVCYDGRYLGNWVDKPIDVIYSKFLFCKYFGETLEPISRGSYTCRPANIAFMFNYEGNPNNGYYSIDYLEETGKIHEPPNPIRDGYDFGGWFADEECTMVWDFDKTEAIISEAYQEIKLYAKWVKN